MKILIIEDNMILSRNITKMLIEDDIFAEMALTGDEGLRKAMVNHYDIIVLDINLPGVDGFDICKKLRENGKEVGIIMLTSFSGLDNVVNGLNIGADDYLTKPFEYEELLARIQVIQRRKMKNSSNTIIKISNITINLQTLEVFKNRQKIKLSKIEFELLKFLAQNRKKALSRKELFETVWGESGGNFMFSRTIDVHVGNLRKKLGERIIETKKGYGFIIN